MNIKVIIPAYNEADAIGKVIAAIPKEVSEVVVVDNNSSDQTATVAEQAGATVLFEPKKGYGHACLKGIAHVANHPPDVLVFLDGDCLPHRSFIADHCKLAEKGCLVQGRRTFIPEKYVSKVLSHQLTIQQLQRTFRLEGWFKSLRFPWPRIKKDQEFYGLLGCNLAAWREDLIAINGFDEAYEGWGIGEDSDLGARLYNLGCHRKFVHGHAIVYHLNHPELPKEHVPASKARLQETIDSKRTRCERGLNQHTSS